MSSIRPLATITVLALVGVFLYLKINETEPPLPAGVEDWSAETDIKFDMVTADPAAAPQFETSPTAPVGSDAPSFATDTASAAPAWSDAPASSAPPTASVSAPSFESESYESASYESESVSNEQSANDTVGGSVAPPLPDLPPLPSLPMTPQSEGLTSNTLPQTAPSAATITAETPGVEPTSVQPTFPPVSSAPVTTPSPSTTSPNTSFDSSSTSSTAQAQSSLFSATRLAVQAALDRGEWSQALLLLSDWHGDPSLTPSEAAEVNSLLGQLAGSVIYSKEHRLEPPYMVQAGERLEAIAKKYDVPWQLLAKINGITSADQLQPGQQLKVVRGPFSARIDLSQRKMTLMLDRRYAGRFTLNLDPSVTVEEGQWEVNQKLLTPANVSLPGTSPTTSTEERSLMLSITSAGATQVAVLRGTMATNSLADPAGRVLRLNPTDAADVFDILSLGSKVVIRR